MEGESKAVETCGSNSFRAKNTRETGQVREGNGKMKEEKKGDTV